jgi:hypothetical protein
MMMDARPYGLGLSLENVDKMSTVKADGNQMCAAQSIPTGHVHYLLKDRQLLTSYKSPKQRDEDI